MQDPALDTAEISPSGMPSSTATISAPRMTASVIGNASEMIPETDWPWLTIELPRSPRASRENSSAS